ncbi:protein fantom-like [Physella acuta]|uniref:protein fantom-like n=1 Tax=Physella acuta TaxID=109671 RepID=UPI0027DC1EB9|nr:protein fantom-like [Physella acuta]
MADDLIPTRDTSNNALRNVPTEAAVQRPQVSKFTRDELEDRFLRMYDEYYILKKYARKQEDKIKRMATKLLRLVNDKKKLEKEGKGGKSIETEEKFEELNAQIRALEKQNAQLREKLMLTKQQLTSVGTKRGTYNHVRAVINTNLPPGKQGATVHIDPRITHKNLRVMGPPPGAQTLSEHQLIKSSPPAHYGPSMLESTVAEKHRLDQLAQMREQIVIYEMEIENLREQNKLQKAEFDEDLLKIKQKITSEQKHTLQENIDMIKLQREIKEKSTMLIALQDKYQYLEQNSRVVKQSHDQILHEMESLTLQFQEEQNRNLALQNQLKMTDNDQRKIFELQEQINDLQRECQVLKEANEKLVTSAFDLEREREWRQKENTLKVQIAQLEATLKSDLGEKGSIIDRYSMERDAHEKLQTEHRELSINYYTLKEQMDDLNEKMKFFTKESQVDFTEIEEALVLIKQKKQREQKPPDFLQAVDDELSQDHKKALVNLQAEFAETVHELEKTRNMLIVQHKINKDYQAEVGILTGKMDEVKREYETKLDEYARLLDIRAARIKKLEAQLRDVAYGTKQYRLPQADDDDNESTTDFDETINLERGQNLFEIHIEKISLSKDALEKIGDEEPCVFCTWEFFEFEIQSTPVVRGARPMFDFTSQYIVRVDDFFLHYIQRESCTVEIHQSFGQDYKTIAACQMVFRDIFDKPHGRIHGTASLTGVVEGETGIGYGTLDFWVRLRVPMEQALRLYKERTKALGYIMTNQRLANQALEALDDIAAQRPPSNVNEMHVKIIRCSRLIPRRKNVQPSPYCAYKLLDFPDHDTIILRNTNDPEFNDHKIYSVPITYEADQYLRTAKLQMFVFDDLDPEVEAYLGMAEIPLLPLAHDKQVSGEFQLTRGAGKAPAGVIEVELRWQYPYLAPKLPHHEPQELEMAPNEPPQRLKPEGQVTREELVGPVRPEAAHKHRAGPSATSTPIDKNKLKAVESQIISPMPKPASRRKVHISEDQPTYSEAHHHSGAHHNNAVDDTVSQVVSGFMPNLSESLSSVPDMATNQSISSHPAKHLSDDEKSVLHTQSIAEEIEEELSARPTPPRASLQMESGSEDETIKETPIKKSVSHSVTDEEDINEEIDEEIAEKEPDSARTSEMSEASEPAAVESDSEGVMLISTPKSKQKNKRPKPKDTVTIVISEVTLEEDSPPMKDENVKQLFVEYRFHAVDPMETETPYSLPKPKPHQSILFNFSKTIPVDMEKNYERRSYLASILLPSHPDKGRLKFTLVSEPPENPAESTEMECEDVGVAYVDIKRMLREGKDLKDQNIDILDAQTEKVVIGHMMVTVECVDVMRAIANEMEVDGTY